MKIRVPLIYASFLVELKNFCTFEDTTIEEREIVSSIFLNKGGNHLIRGWIAFLAFWGAPIEQPNHAELAVRCALNISKKLDELRERWKEEGKPAIDCGMGLNTGEVLVGNIGVEGKKMDYTVIGDSVNLAAKVEKLTRQYGTRMLLTEYTLEHIKECLDSNRLGHIKLTDLDEVKVKGKEKGVRVYKLEFIEKT